MLPSLAVHRMKVSRNGQISLPAAVRERWDVESVQIVDMGDHLVVRPLAVDPVTALRGKYAGVGPSSDEARRRSRDEETEAEDRKYGALAPR